jgi:hypothetical protein
MRRPWIFVFAILFSYDLHWCSRRRSRWRPQIVTAEIAQLHGDHPLGSVWLPTSSVVACGAHLHQKTDYPQHSHSISATSQQRPLLFGRDTVLNVPEGAPYD